VPERDAPLAGSGDSARITLQALPGETFEESVSRVAGTMDERTRTMLVEIDLPNPDGRLLPGMFRQAAIALEPSRERITRPANAEVRPPEETSQNRARLFRASGRKEFTPHPGIPLPCHSRCAGLGRGRLNLPIAYEHI
jgi:multidrug efflux pump subunit AcrA (membrane-fusion protein)